jgi:hypothetical protein
LGPFSKNCITFYSKNYNLALKHIGWDPGYGKNLFRIPDPGVKKAPDPGSRIRICNTSSTINLVGSFALGRDFNLPMDFLKIFIKMSIESSSNFCWNRQFS